MAEIIGVKLKASNGMVYQFVSRAGNVSVADAVTFHHSAAVHLLLKMFEHLYDIGDGRDLISVAGLVDYTLSRRARLDPKAHQTEVLQVVSQALVSQKLFCVTIPETKPVILHEEAPEVPPSEQQSSLPKAGAEQGVEPTNGQDTVRADTPQVPIAATSFCGDPVSMVTGEEILPLIDVVLAGSYALEWGRTYRSGLCDVDTGLGFGWRSHYDYQLTLCPSDEVSPAQWQFIDNEGAELFFDDIEPGAVSYQVRAGASLYHHPQQYYLLRLQDGRQLKFSFIHDAWRLDKLRIDQTTQYSFRYSLAGRMIGIDVNGYHSLALRYDASGHLVSTEIPHYDKSEAIVVLSSYQYDAQGNLISAINRQKQTEQYQYRDDHLLTCRTRASGFSHYFEWQGEGAKAKCCAQSGDEGVYQYQFDYSEQNQTTISTDSRGHQWRYTHDHQGLLLRKESPTGAVWQYRYNELGLKTADIDPNDGMTFYRYNAQGLLSELQTADGSINRYRYNRFGQCVEEQNALGQVTLHRFNSLGLLLATIHFDGREESYRYDHQGRVVEHVLPTGEQRQYWWNERGLLDAVQHNQATTRYSYDRKGEMNGIAYPDGRVSAFTRDISGNITQVTHHFPESDEASETHNYQYDDAGRVTQYIDPLGRTTKTLWGGLSQPEATIQADGSELYYDYDLERNLVAIRRSDECVFELDWDEEERLSRTVGFDGREQHYRYDANGELTEVDEHHRQLRMMRDAAGRIIELHATCNTGERTSHHYQYDKIGRCINANTPARRLSYEWSHEDKPITVWQDHWRIDYHFNAKGLRDSLTLPDGTKLVYQYDDNQQLTKLIFNGEVLLEFQRDNQGRELRRLQANGICLEHHFDGRGYIAQQKWQAVNSSLSSECAEYEHHCHYLYDDAGQLTRIHDQQRGQQSFGYDALSQLQYHEQGATKTAYQFDGFGNHQTDESEVYQDRLHRYKDCTYSYDKCGNQTKSRSESCSQFRQFNGLNQLSQTNHNSRISDYQYDALGRRSKKITEQGEIDFLWDDNQLLGEHQQGCYRWYVYAPDDYTPLLLIENGQVYFYHTDHIGTPHTLTDRQGKVVWQANYRTFGYADVTVEIIQNPLRYQGQYFDAESELHYNRFRYYDPLTGRFIHQDPIGLLGGINHYRYAPNPIQWVDPLGLSCKEGGGNALLNSAYLVGGITKYFGDTVTGTAEAIYADPFAVAWDTLYTVVDAAYYPIDIMTRPFGFTTHAVDRTNARINDALGAAQELKANTVANWECRNWEGLGSNLAAIGMVVNPRSLVKGNVTPAYKNLEPVIKLAPGKKGGWNKTLNKDLQLNAIYKVGNYTYKTDDLGRVKSVSGELDLSKLDRNTYQQAKAGKTHGIKDGLIDDEGGHLIASIFKGPGEQINYAAMDGNLNKGEWKRMENKWAKALKGDPPKKVEVEINAIYDGDSKRPSTFDVFYEIDGVEKFVSFKNKPEGKLL